MGLDNSGYLVFDVDIEMEPKTYNTSNSKLWTKVRRVFKDELAKMYRDMRASTFKEENLFNILIGEQIDKIPESLYNEDSERKYIKNPKYLHMLHGSRREHMRKWIRERLLYLDSQFGYEKNTSESIIIRANKKGRVELNIKTYSPMFVKVRWRNDSTSTELKKVGRNEIVSFVGDLPTETDQEIAIYGAKHIKEIGDISHMTPSSLTLGNATRLTKIECRNSPNLKAIGLGGTASEDGGRLKNLQLIDLTGCTKLGQDTSSAELNVSYCDNLKTLKIQNTNLKSVTFNTEGGNLEEMYLPNSLTSLYLNNQYSLREVEFPGNTYARRLYHKFAYDEGSKISTLTIINCPNLTHLGVNWGNFFSDELKNYAGQQIISQSSNFDISKEDYKQAYTLSIFGRLENVNITNSLLNYKYYNLQASPSLKTLSLTDMPNLKGVIFTGNRMYSAAEWQLFEGDPAFQSIAIDKCSNFEDIIIQNGCGVASAFKFTKNFEWDLSNLPLKRFICNMALQNLNKIILPKSITEFRHSNTILQQNAVISPAGYSNKYTADMSPLETIVVKGHYEEGFTGIDLADIPLKNVSLGGLTQQVAIIQNVNCKAIDIIPKMISDHITEQPLGKINIDLNEYKLSSLHRLFYNADISQVTVTLDKKLTTENMDYSYMFYKTKKVRWENIKDFIKNLPSGKLSYTFQHCDVDRLEVGHMMGSATTAGIGHCFSDMPNVTEINLEGGNFTNINTLYGAFMNSKNLTKINLANCDFSQITNFSYCFAGNSKLEQIIGAENLIQDKCQNVSNMFYQTSKLKFNFPKGKPSWRFSQKQIDINGFMSYCGSNVNLLDNEEYILDLSDCGAIKTPQTRNALAGLSFTNIILNRIESDYNDGLLQNCPNLKTLSFADNTILKGEARWLIGQCPELISVNMSGVNMEGLTVLDYFFHNNKNLTDVEFGHGLKNSVNFSGIKKLTKTSLLSILNNVGTAKSGATLTLSQDSWDLLSDEDRNIAARKGWTIARG